MSLLRQTEEDDALTMLFAAEMDEWATNPEKSSASNNPTTPEHPA